MIAVQNVVAVPLNECLRPYDVRRDLSQVADLVELCFADTLDEDGQAYLRQMRSAARNMVYLRWTSTVGEKDGVPLSGYVWEEDGKIIGNLSLIPFHVKLLHYYLIANVAVHPEHRRRGVARALTGAALEHAQKRRATAAWLHVREENTAAVELYRSVGFSERAQRSTWQNRPEDRKLAGSPLLVASNKREYTNVKVGSRKGGDWHLQKAWLDRLYPAEISWQLSLNHKWLAPGFWGEFQKFFTDVRVLQWAAREGDFLMGVLAWHATATYADDLWLAAHPEHEEAVAYDLLRHACHVLPPHRALSLDYPAGRADQAIQAAGFNLQQTLIWMSLPIPT